MRAPIVLLAFVLIALAPAPSAAEAAPATGHVEDPLEDDVEGSLDVTRLAWSITPDRLALTVDFAETPSPGTDVYKALVSFGNLSSDQPTESYIFTLRAGNASAVARPSRFPVDDVAWRVEGASIVMDVPRVQPAPWDLDCVAVVIQTGLLGPNVTKASDTAPDLPSISAVWRERASQCPNAGAPAGSADAWPDPPGADRFFRRAVVDPEDQENPALDLVRATWDVGAERGNMTLTFRGAPDPKAKYVAQLFLGNPLQWDSKESYILLTDPEPRLIATHDLSYVDGRPAVVIEGRDLKFAFARVPPLTSFSCGTVVVTVFPADKPIDRENLADALPEAKELEGLEPWDFAKPACFGGDAPPLPPFTPPTSKPTPPPTSPPSTSPPPPGTEPARSPALSAAALLALGAGLALVLAARRK